MILPDGSTRIWPKSHKSGKRVQDLKINFNSKFKLLTAKKGSIIIFLGQLWHQIGENTFIDGLFATKDGG